MRKTALLTIAGLFLSVSFAGAQAPVAKTASAGQRAQDTGSALTLQDCYRLALQQSEIIAIDSEAIKEAEAHFLQAFGTLMPQVSFVSQNSWTDPHAASATQRKNGYERRFSFTQTLFSGFKEFAGMSASTLERNERVNEKTRAEQLLFTDVSDAFYLFSEQLEDLRILETIKNALTNRIEELGQREKLGRSRRSEVVNTQVQFYVVKAEIELAKSQVELARQLLEFLVGRPVASVIDSAKEMPSLDTEANYILKVALRPDVKAAELAWGLAKKEITVARSGFFPSVSLGSSYYQHRTTAPVKSRWDTMLTVDIPIFEGTTTFGAVKLANAHAAQAELQFQRTKRLAAQDIRNSYLRLTTSIARNQALQNALSAAELNYALQRQDYKLSLVNNLDVLQAIQSLAETRRNATQTHFETKRLYWQLQVALGESLAENIK